MTQREAIFTMEATPIKYGAGACDDAGWELKRMGVAQAMLVSDRGVIEAGITERVRAAIEVESIEVELFDRVRVEPTDESMQEAADFALDGGFDGFVGVGGGSCLDTAKVADLVATHPAAIMDYVNHPVGGGRKPPSPLKPLLAIPTTARPFHSRDRPASPDDRPPSGTPTVAIRRSTPTSRGGSPLRSRSRPPTSMPRPSRHCCAR